MIRRLPPGWLQSRRKKPGWPRRECSEPSRSCFLPAAVAATGMHRQLHLWDHLGYWNFEISHTKCLNIWNIYPLIKMLIQYANLAFRTKSAVTLCARDWPRCHSIDSHPTGAPLHSQMPSHCILGQQEDKWAMEFSMQFCKVFLYIYIYIHIWIIVLPFAALAEPAWTWRAWPLYGRVAEMLTMLPPWLCTTDKKKPKINAQKQKNEN